MLAPLLSSAWLVASPPTIPSAGEIDHEPRPDTPHIYGGEEVEPGEWPAVVGVETSQLCTGTLVAPNLVLTASHCISPTTSVVRVTFGDDLASGIEVDAEAWGRHPDFCLPADCGEDLHDFAWIRLPEPMAGIEPILPITDQLEYDELMRVGAELRFVGFGENESGIIGIKRQVTAALMSFNESGREFRAGGEGKDTCLGDSGGPALVQLEGGQWRLAGVISRGGDCGEGGIYGVPFPELCWLRDDSGVDLLPAGCEGCDCLTLRGAPDEDEGCSCGVDREQPAPWWVVALELSALAGVFAWRRRTRSPSHR